MKKLKRVKRKLMGQCNKQINERYFNISNKLTYTLIVILSIVLIGYIKFFKLLLY